MAVNATNWPGLITDMDPHDLPVGSAQIQTNVQSITAGVLAVRKGAQFYQAGNTSCGATGNIVALARYRGDSADYLVIQTDDGNVYLDGLSSGNPIEGNVSANIPSCWQQNRHNELVRVNGLERGSIYRAGSVFPLGIDAPANVANVSASGNTGNSFIGNYFCGYRFVDGNNGREVYSALSDITTVTANATGQQFDWTIDNITDTRISKAQCFRSTMGQASVFYLAGEITTGNTTLTDTMSDAELSGQYALPLYFDNDEPCARRQIPPPTFMGLVCEFQDRFWYAGPNSQPVSLGNYSATAGFTKPIVGSYTFTNGDQSQLVSDGNSISMGGTFTLNWGNQTTPAIPWNATALQIQHVLEGLTSIGTGNVSCTGGPLPFNPVVVEFIGSFAIDPANVATQTPLGNIVPANAITNGNVNITTVHPRGVIPRELTLDIVININNDSQGLDTLRARVYDIDSANFTADVANLSFPISASQLQTALGNFSHGNTTTVTGTGNITNTDQELFWDIDIHDKQFFLETDGISPDRYTYEFFMYNSSVPGNQSLTVQNVRGNRGAFSNEVQSLVGNFSSGGGGDIGGGTANISTTTAQPVASTQVVSSNPAFVFAAAPPEVNSAAYYSEPDEPESVPLNNVIVISDNIEDTDEVQAMVPYGAVLLFIKQRCVYRLTYATSPSDPGTSIRQIASRGVLNNRCWDMYLDNVVLMDALGAWILDADGKPNPISDPIQDYWRDEKIDFTKAAKFFVAVEPNEAVARFGVILTGSSATRVDTVLCYSLKTQSWWTEGYRATFGGRTRMLQGPLVRSIVGGNTGNPLMLANGTSDNYGGNSTANIAWQFRSQMVPLPTATAEQPKVTQAHVVRLTYPPTTSTQTVKLGIIRDHGTTYESAARPYLEGGVTLDPSQGANVTAAWNIQGNQSIRSTDPGVKEYKLLSSSQRRIIKNQFLTIDLFGNQVSGERVKLYQLTVEADEA